MVNSDNKIRRFKENLPFIIILFAFNAWGTLKFYDGLMPILSLFSMIPLLVWFFVFSDLKGFSFKTPFARNFVILSFIIPWALISTVICYFNLYSSAQWAYISITTALFLTFAYIAANRKSIAKVA